jgi:transaldolase
MMKENPLKLVQALGQSIWLDDINRKLINSGELYSLLEDDGLRGMTSNPAIFEKAIVDSQEYDQDIRDLKSAGKSTQAIYATLTQGDVKSAADVFRHLYDDTQYQDGYVSLEVNPHLAHDATATIEEARRLWTELHRPNVFIKVPATEAGLIAIQQLITEGINVNVTLLFGLNRYRQAAEAYIAGIEARVAQGKPVKQVASVASFFVSRIDALLDPQLDILIAEGGEEANLAKLAKGQIAIASAKVAYQIYQNIFDDARFRPLVAQGARAQRLLWASTSPKNPDYNDIKYVEALIGKHTINTLPPATLAAYRNHGKPQPRLEQDTQEARRLLEQLPELGINLEAVTQQLEDEGVEKFIKPFDKLMTTLAKAYVVY